MFKTLFRIEEFRKILGLAMITVYAVYLFRDRLIALAIFLVTELCIIFVEEIEHVVIKYKNLKNER